MTKNRDKRYPVAIDDLLIEFDEMDYCPMNLSGGDPVKEAIAQRDRLRYELDLLLDEKSRLGKSDFIEGERMSWLEGYVKEFPDSTPEDIIWAWMNKNHQATIGDEKILFDALSKVWVKYKMYV